MLYTEVCEPGASSSSPLKVAAAALAPSPRRQDSDSARAALAAQTLWHRGGLPPRALQRVREFIEAHLEENISLQVLADIAGLSMYHFSRAFKQSEGVTPHDYIVRSRVKRVQELLADTNLQLSEIAVAAGFADQSHCARRFREHVGLTPSKYRWLTR
jgi:transcriptional regulator GlxA family with amidase domain